MSAGICVANLPPFPCTLQQPHLQNLNYLVSQSLRLRQRHFSSHEHLHQQLLPSFPIDSPPNSSHLSNMRASIRSSCFQRIYQQQTLPIFASRCTPIRALHSLRLTSVPAAPLSRRVLQPQPWQSASFVRCNTSLAASPIRPSPTTPASSSPTATHPAYEIFFTCKPCSHRSGPHRVTKQGFHKGTTLITCPSCKNRHVVSDHLRIFTDEGGDLVDIMKRHGEKLKKGKLGIRDGRMGEAARLVLQRTKLADCHGWG